MAPARVGPMSPEEASSIGDLGTERQVQPSAGVQPRAAVVEPTCGRIIRIVFFEPLLAALRVERSFLQRRQFRLLSAASAGKLQDLVATFKPDAVVIADDMPRNLDPLEVLTHLKQAVPGSDTWFLVIAGRHYRRLIRLPLEPHTVVLPAPCHREEILFHLARCLRISSRKYVRRTVVIETFRGKESKVFIGTTRDLSEGGMLLESSDSFAIGDRLQINFTLLNNVQIHAQAQVLRIESESSGLYHVSMRFTDMHKDVREKLAKFLEAGIDH